MKHRLRILAAIIVPPHLSASGGARAAEQLSAALTSYCDVTVASMMNGKGADAASRVDRAKVRSWLPWGLPWSLLPRHLGTLFYRSDIPRKIAAGQYDLVHLHNPMPALEMARIARACLRHQIPYIVSTHGFNEIANGENIYGFDWIRRAIWRSCVVRPVKRSLRHTSAVFALSLADLEILRRFGFSKDVCIVSNGIDPPRNKKGLVSDESLLKRIGVSSRHEGGAMTCLFLANHTPNKGLPDLLKAFAALDEPYLLIVAGERRQGVDYEAAQAACKNGQQIVVTGRLSDDEVDAVYRRSDVFVFPTLADTFPLVVLEALVHGVPVIASRVGGIPHQLDDHCGIMFEPGDVGALSAAVKSLASDPERRRKLSEGARRRAENFTWERSAAAAMRGYHRALQKPTGAVQSPMTGRSEYAD